jgi:hypothetical protein
MTAPVVKLRTPAELIQAVPRLLGYPPSDSVVVICLHGKRRRLGLTLRYDLEIADVAPVELVDEIAARIRHDSATEVFVVVYAEEPPALDSDLPFRELADLMEAKWRFPLGEMLLAADGRWWSYLCDDPTCCSGDGTPIAAESEAIAALSAALALSGKGMVANRRALAGTIALDDDADTQSWRDDLAAAVTAGDRLDRPTHRSRLADLIDDLATRFEDPRTVIEDAEAAEIAVLSRDVIARDDVLVQGSDPQRRDVLLQVFRAASRRVPSPFDAPVCGMLAWLAYADGDGTIANIALHRALGSDPGYSLALLLVDCLDRQIPPEQLQAVMRDAAVDLDDRSAAG